MAALGAGPVGKSTVASIMILRQARSFLEQKIIMMEPAVEARMGSKKKSIVLAAIVGIVENAGRDYFSVCFLVFVFPDFKSSLTFFTK